MTPGREGASPVPPDAFAWRVVCDVEGGGYFTLYYATRAEAELARAVVLGESHPPLPPSFRLAVVPETRVVAARVAPIIREN